MRAKTILTACAAAMLCAPACASEVYLTGFGHIFSVGICGIGPGRCSSYLAVEAVAQEICASPPREGLKIAGHSMGASAAIRLAHMASACGVKVKAVALLDPLAHPYDMPKGARVLTIYSPAFAGIGEGKADAERYGGPHITMTFDPALRDRVRSFFDGRAKP